MTAGRKQDAGADDRRFPGWMLGGVFLGLLVGVIMGQPALGVAFGLLVGTILDAITKKMLS